MKKKILVLNGPNLNLLGERELSIYGTTTLDAINSNLQQQFTAIEFTFLQSNNESELINVIQNAAKQTDGVIINVGGFSHTSIAIADAIAAIKIPTIAVHISNIYNRENFRHIDIVGEKCVGNITGMGIEGYQLAVQCLIEDYFC